MNKHISAEELVDAIHNVMKGTKPVDHAKHHSAVANKKVADVQSNVLNKSYDISGDLDKEKPIDVPGVEFDYDADEDDLEYIKHKMGMDTPGEKHEDDTEKDVIEKDPTKKISFSEYVKNDDIRRSHLRRAKINYTNG